MLSFFVVNKGMNTFPHCSCSTSVELAQPVVSDRVKKRVGIRGFVDIRTERNPTATLDEICHLLLPYIVFGKGLCGKTGVLDSFDRLT